MSLSPGDTAPAPTPLKRGDRVRVRAGNLLRWINNGRKEPIKHVVAVVELAPKGRGHYLLRSELVGGFAAPLCMIELVEAAEPAEAS